MENKISVCDRVQETSAERLFAWLASFEDTQLRCDLAEHLTLCRRCSKVFKAALALEEAALNPDEESTLSCYVTKPLRAWIATSVQPVPFYGPERPVAETARMWSLQVGAAESMRPTNIRVISTDDGAVLVSAQSEDPELDFAVRAFNGSEALFETSVKGDGVPSIVHSKSEISESTDIEVVECR